MVSLPKSVVWFEVEQRYECGQREMVKYSEMNLQGGAFHTHIYTYIIFRTRCTPNIES